MNVFSGSVRDSRSQAAVLRPTLGAECFSPDINGPNGLACLCVTALDKLKSRPCFSGLLPGFPVVRNVIVDMPPEFDSYARNCWLLLEHTSKNASHYNCANCSGAAGCLIPNA